MIRRAVAASARARLEWLAARLSAIDPASEVLLLAPTRGAADDFVRLFVPAGRLGIHRFTLPQLASAMAAEESAVRDLAPISRLGLEALAARSVFRLKARLQYLQPVADTPGFPGALAATISDLRMAGVAPAAVEGDVGLLYTEFLAELDDGRFADYARMYEIATVAPDTRFLGLPLLLLDLGVDTRVEQALLDRLIATAPSAFATAWSGEGEHLDPTPATAMARVQRRIFSTAFEDAAADATLDFFSAASEGLEFVEIARRIRKLDIAFDRIAILLRDPNLSQPLAEEALRRAGIPIYAPRGSDRPDPAGRAFLALLDCAAEHLSATRFAEFLSLGQVRRSEDAPEREWIGSADEVQARDATPPTGAAPGHPPAPPAPYRWEHLLIDAAVIGGRDRWEARLAGLEREIEMQLVEISSEDDAAAAHLERRLDQLRHLESYALPLIARLDDLRQPRNWGDWLDALNELARDALSRPATVLAALEELRPMAEVGPVTIPEVRAVLGERLGFLRADPPGARYGAVFVCSIEEALGREFDAVFLPGLAEGAFPRRIPEDPLLLDAARAALSADLPVRDHRLARERDRLRIAVGAATRLLAVSYPRSDAGQGRARVPSFYALEVLRAAEGRLPRLRELERRASAGAPTRLGWPAPALPEDAIDNAEHDLALLEPLLHGEPRRNRGRGTYLLRANQHLARTLRARGRRWRAGWFDADGLVDPDAAARAVLATHRLDARPYSASALQHWAACPYRFFLSAIAGLRERDEAVALEQLDPLTRGAIFHEIQFRLFSILKDRRLLPITAVNVTWALELADSVVRTVADEYRDLLAPAILRVWNSAIETIKNDVRAWVRMQPEIQSEWRPVHAELAFGLTLDAGHDPASRADPVHLTGVTLRGSIDLVERAAAGAIRITDHKTGKSPQQSLAYIGGGETLQPVLYSLAAEQLLGTPAHSGRLFYCTQRGGFSEVDVPIDDRARDIAVRALAAVDASIAEGFLPAAPRKNACEHCDYRIVCGPYEETRTAKKQRARLEPLDDVRRMP